MKGERRALEDAMLLQNLDRAHDARALRYLDHDKRGAVAAVWNRRPQKNLRRHGQEQDEQDDPGRAEEPMVAKPQGQPLHSTAPPARCASSQDCRRITAATWSITFRRRARLT